MNAWSESSLAVQGHLADFEEHTPAQRPPLPFGIRLDKWRIEPKEPAHAPMVSSARRPARAGLTAYKTQPQVETRLPYTISDDGHRDPLALGAGPWPFSPPSAATSLFKQLTLIVLDDRRPPEPSNGAEVAIPSATKLPQKKQAVLGLLTVSKLKGMRKRADAPAAHKKTKGDTEWVKDRFIELLTIPDNLLAHGFTEIDAKTLGLYSLHLRIEKGDVFATPGTPCQHVAMILEGRLAAYHHATLLATFGAGSHVGTMGLTAENCHYAITLVAEEDTFVALLPHQRILSYIQDLPVERQDKITKYCFEVLFASNLDLDHKREVLDAASVVQNSFRCHRARSEFWRIRNHREAPSANVITRVWRGHRARMWTW